MNRQDIRALIAQAEHDCAPVFAKLEAGELYHTQRVLRAFHEENVASRHFAPTTGYGYDDIGRDTLERIFASLFGTEAAIVRPHIVSGTAALSLSLFGLLLPAVCNALFVGWELAVYVGGGFWINALYVAIGEAAVLLTLGAALYYTVKNRGLDKKILK